MNSESTKIAVSSTNSKTKRRKPASTRCSPISNIKDIAISLRLFPLSLLFMITDILRVIVGRINDDDENDEIKNDIGEDK